MQTVEAIPKCDPSSTVHTVVSDATSSHRVSAVVREDDVPRGKKKPSAWADGSERFSFLDVSKSNS